MPRVRLKVNLIIGKQMLRAGTVIDKKDVPAGLLKRKYLELEEHSSPATKQEDSSEFDK